MDLDRVTGALADRYEKLEEIGRGGMGVVFRGRQRGLGRAVAIKVATAPAPEDRARFRAEAQALAQLDHPGIVALYEADLEGDTPWFAMPLVEGRSLADRTREGRMPVSRVLGIAAKVAAALAHAHARGIVHRDVKPENILITESGDVRLADFGIARWTGGRPEGIPATAPGTVLGSPHYMAPEQIHGTIGPATDVYGLGATLFELLTGKPPYPYDDLLAILNGHLKEAVPPVPGVPRAVEALVRAMLAKDPGRRPADGTALALAIERARQELEPQMTDVRNPIARTPARSYGWVALAFLGGALIAGAVQRRPPPPVPVVSASAEPVDTRSVQERAKERVERYLPVLGDPLTINITNASWARVRPLPKPDRRAMDVSGLLEPSQAGRPLEALFDGPKCPQYCLNPQNVEFVIPPPPAGGYRMELAIRGAGPRTRVLFGLDFSEPHLVNSPTVEGDLTVFRTVASPHAGRNVATWVVVDPELMQVHLARIAARPVGTPAAPPPAPDSPKVKLTGDAVALEEQVDVAWNRGQWDRAAQLLRELLVRVPDAEALRARLGEAQHRAKMLSEAVETFDAYLRDRPGAAWPWSDLSVTLLDMGRVQEARKLAIHALRLVPDRTWFWINLGRIELAAGDRDRAIDHVKFALVCDPDSKPAQDELKRMTSLR